MKPELAAAAEHSARVFVEFVVDFYGRTLADIVNNEDVMTATDEKIIEYVRMFHRKTKKHLDVSMPMVLSRIVELLEKRAKNFEEGKKLNGN